MSTDYCHVFVDKGQLPHWLIDLTRLKEACEQLRQLELADIDEYLSAERALQERGATLLTTIKVNGSMLALAGVENEEQFKRDYLAIFGARNSNFFRQFIAACLKEEQHALFETILSPGGRQPRYLEVYLDLGQVEDATCGMLTFVDISQQKESITQLKESMEKYRLLVTAANDAVVIVDCRSGSIQEVNPRAVELFARPVGELVGMDHEELFPRAVRGQYFRYYQSQLEGGGNSPGFDSVIGDNRGGGDIPVQLKIATAVINGRRIAQITFHDIRKRQKLEERRRLLATAIDQAAESVMITDPSGKIEYVNPAFEETSGYEFGEVVGKSPKMFRSKGYSRLESNLMWQEISQGKVWRGTFANRKKDGSCYQEEATITPVKDDAGTIRHYVTVKRDITRQLALEDQIRQSQKMQAIGTLAGGVAHDFNNILTAILGYAELSQARCDQGTVLYDNLAEIISGAERAGKLVGQILQFSRQSEKSTTNLQIDLIVKEVLKLLRASLPANIEIIANLAREVFVKADPTQIHQVVLNLCTNAFQALEKTGGEIRLSLERVNLSPQQGLEIGNLSPGPYVRIMVEDNGAGIPKEYLPRIFEPYFTTKDKNQGTGLGLSVVHGIVNDHRGAVTVESVSGEGARFSLYLPEVELAEEGEEEPRADYGFQGGRILVVDDEPQIVDFQTQVLEHLGCQVISSPTSSQALEIFVREGGNFDLVITDMGMPGMTGLELFERLQAIQPGVKVLLCTGFSTQVTPENAEELGLAGYLEKPFNAEELAMQVSLLLKEEWSSEQ